MGNSYSHSHAKRHRPLLPKFHIGSKTKSSGEPTPVVSRSEVARATWDTTDEFIPPVDGGKVIKVYDGDTITVATTLPWASYMTEERGKVYRFGVRLRGLDTPELRGAESEEEKEMGYFVQNKLESMLLDEFVRLENVEVEKYGRILATVIRESDNLNMCEWLLDKRMAVPYDGGTKVSPKSWRGFYNGTNKTLQHKS